MRIGTTWTTAEIAEIVYLCQRTHELLIKLDFLLGVERPPETLSAEDISSLIRLQIEQNQRDIAELKEMLHDDGRQRTEKGGSHDR